MLEEILPHLTLVRLVGGVLGLIIVGWQVNKLWESRKIASLGGRAPIRPGSLPMAVDIIVKSVYAGIQNKLYELWRECMLTYGNPKDPYTAEVTVVGRRIIITADPENIKAVLATQFQDYGKGARFNREWHDFLGDSIFTTDGKLWQDSRQLLRPQFIKDRVSDLDIFEKHTQILLSQMGGDGQEVDMLDLFFKYTLDAATDFLLGSSVDSLTSRESTFADAFGTAQTLQSRIARAGPLNFLVSRKEFHGAIRKIDRFIQPFIERVVSMSTSPEELEQSGARYNFLHALAAYTKDRTVLRDQLYAVLLAGRDTTACTLAWTVYELSKAPGVVEKLREEIRATVGPERAPTYLELKNMRYLQHIMNEVLRLYPVVPFNVRIALRDCTLPRGAGPDADQPVGIPAGTAVAYSTLIMQRREDLYPSAESGFPPVLSFVPERWDSWTPKSWQYIPFNGGPRICIGQQFALSEMAYTLVRIFQRFQVVESRMSEHPGMKADIVLQPLNGVKVAFWTSKV